MSLDLSLETYFKLSKKCCIKFKQVSVKHNFR